MKQSTYNAELPELSEEFVQHVWRHAAMAGALIVVSLAIGVIGFRISEPHPGWIDSYLNAAMLLGGMGPIDAKELSPAGRIFEATYALYCGLVFVVVIAIILKPFLSRVIRRLDAIHMLHIRVPASPEKQVAQAAPRTGTALSPEGSPNNGSHFRIVGPAPASHPIYSTGYVIGCLASTVKPKQRIKLLSDQ
jgi:hypothetical protein